MGHHKRGLEGWRTAVEVETGRDDLRAQPLPFRDFFSQRHQRFEVTAHIPHAGDSIGEQKREHEFSAAVRFARGGQMHVHVRQAGDEKLPVGVENLRAPRNCDRRRWTQSCDSFFFQ